MTQGVYLATYLAPLSPWLDREDVTDIVVNRPGEVWIETHGRPLHAAPAPALTELALGRLARQIAGASHQAVSRDQPLLSASLPDGARVQVISPPATRDGHALAVRKHRINDLALSDLARSGLFAPPDTDAEGGRAELRGRLERGDLEGFLRSAVRGRRTLVLCGGTASGKTTLLNSLVKEIPSDERLIAIEDAPEIRLPEGAALGLVAVRGETGEARVDAEALLQACLRMRPDRILLGELRGAEAFAFLRAVNTGHPGSITTLHADTTAGALDQIAMMSLLGGLNLDWAAVRAYAAQVIDIIVQLKRVNGRRQVSEVMFMGETFRSDARGFRPSPT